MCTDTHAPKQARQAKEGGVSGHLLGEGECLVGGLGHSLDELMWTHMTLERPAPVHLANQLANYRVRVRVSECMYVQADAHMHQVNSKGSQHKRTNVQTTCQQHTSTRMQARKQASKQAKKQASKQASIDTSRARQDVQVVTRGSVM